MPSVMDHSRIMIEHSTALPVLLGKPVGFPDPERAAAEGLVAVGGDLSVERLLAACRSGIFPWSVNPITWWSPDPRGIIKLDQFHVSRCSAKAICRGMFEVTINYFGAGFSELAENEKPLHLSAFSAPPRLSPSEIHRAVSCG